MRILFLASAGSTHSHKWIHYFANKNHEICWVSLHSAAMPVESRIDYHQICKAPNWYRLCLAFFKLWKILRQFKPDVLHVHSAGTYGLMGWLLGFENTILTVWGSDILLNKTKPVLRIVLARILAASKLLTTDARHMIQEIRLLGVKKTPIKLINFGVDTDVFRPKNPQNYIKQKYGLKDGAGVISLRAFSPIYDLETLIYAAEIVLTHHSSVHFYLCGSGKDEQKLKQLVLTLGLQERIHFLGFVANADLSDLLNSMDAYVSTSLSDAGIASSTAEAMACGLTPIISDVYDNHDWVDDGKNGFLFAAGDPAKLASKLTHVFSMTQEQRQNCGIAARKKIISNNDFFVEMLKMEKLLEQLIGESK